MSQLRIYTQLRLVVLLSWVGMLLLGCAPTSKSSLNSLQTPVAKPMKLESTAFTDKGLIPSKYTCDGEDISPPLSWSEPPSGTKSLALIVDDPDAPGKTFVHWVLYDIPATARALPDNVAAEGNLPSGSLQGKNDFGKLGYGGPCPPGGTHRYFFKLYALDTKLGLESGATKAQVLVSMDGHILAEAELMGRYQRQ